MEKKIEVCELPISELQDKLGNPRTIKSKKAKELQESIEYFGDFGIIVVDENNNIISGHQRVKAISKAQGDSTKVLCKRLIGYSNADLKAINIKANTHAGDWDLNKLADWTADLQVKLGLELPNSDAENAPIKDMELIRYEKYDYVMIVCRSEVDYNNLVRALGIEGKKVLVANTKKGGRKIKCRAIWYEKIKKLWEK